MSTNPVWDDLAKAALSDGVAALIAGTLTAAHASDSCNTGAPNEQHDAAMPSASNLVAAYDATGVRRDRLAQACVDRPVEMVAGSWDYGYATDGLGSVDRLTDANGATAETYAYDAWGGTTASGSVSNPFQFTGQTLDSSGLYDYRARRYDPSSNGGHRFTSQDPAGNGCAYAGDSPATSSIRGDASRTWRGEGQEAGTPTATSSSGRRRSPRCRS